MPPPRPTMSPRDWALLLFLSVLWGGSFFFNQVAVAALPPLTVVAVRVALAAAILLAVLRTLGLALPRQPAALRAILVMGLLNNAVPFTLIVWSQSQITSGVAAILNASTPLFTVLLAHGLTADERLTPGRLAGVLVGLGGVAAMLGAAGLGAHRLAELACLGAALSYALAGIYGRRLPGLGLPPLASAAGQMTAASLVLVPLALAVDRPWALPPPGRRRHRRAGRARRALHRARLRRLLPPARAGGRHEPAARHLPRPGHGDPPRRRGARRGADAAPPRRHGADRPRSRRHRRPRAHPAS